MENHREIQSKCDLCLKRYSRDGGHIRTRMKYIGCEHFSCRTCTNELKGSNDHFECPFCSRVIMECSEDLVFDRILDLLVDLEADLAEKTEFLKNLRNKEHDGFSMKRRYTFSELEKEEVKSKPYRIIEVYPRQVETTDNRSKSKEHKNPSNTTPRLSSHSNGNEGFFTSNKSEMTRMHTMNKQPYSTIYEQNESDSKHHH